MDELAAAAAAEPSAMSVDHDEAGSADAAASSYGHVDMCQLANDGPQTPDTSQASGMPPNGKRMPTELALFSRTQVP